MSDVECPYCGAENEICNDDGHGCEEGKTYEEQCGECEKYFIFSPSYSVYYHADKADCLNGSPHDFRDRYWDHWPEGSYLTCRDCEERVRYNDPKYAELRKKLTKTEVGDANR